MVLVSCCLLERDVHGNVLLTWAYPEVDPDAEPVLKSRSHLVKPTSEDAIEAMGESGSGIDVPATGRESFSKYKQSWIHIITVPTVAGGALPPKVTHVALTLTSDTFHPEKYLALARLLVKLYLQKGTPLHTLECFLGVFTKGSYLAEGVKFNDFDYDIRHAYLASSLKDVITLLGEEVILVWVALMTKKRIGVFCSDLDQLLNTVRAFPLFVWHRQSWDTNLWPYITNTENEITDLQNTGVYTVGFVDHAIKNNTELFDLVVDLDAKSVTVLQHAKDSFMLAGFHRDLMNFLVESSTTMTDQAIIKELALRTKTLLTKLESLKEEGGFVTLESIHTAKVNPPLDRFLYNVAIAEEMAASQEEGTAE